MKSCGSCCHFIDEGHQVGVETVVAGPWFWTGGRCATAANWIAAYREIAPVAVVLAVKIVMARDGADCPAHEPKEGIEQ